MNLINRLKQNTVVKNFSYVTSGSILAQILNLLALIFIAKILTPSSYGLYTFLTMQGLLIYTLADLGIRNITIRAIARDKFVTNDIILNGILLRVISVASFSVIYYFYNHLFGHLNNIQFLLVCLFAFFNCITFLFESTFWGHQKMLAPAIVNVSTSLLFLGIVLALPKQSISVEHLFMTFLVINNLITGLCYFIALKYLKLFVGARQPFIFSTKNLLRQSWPYFVLVLLNLPYNYLTNNFLDINSTKVQIAYFNLAQKLTSPFLLIISFSLSSIFPYLANLWTTDENKLKEMISKNFKVFFLSLLSLCFLYNIFAYQIVMLFFDHKYLEVVLISKVQIWFTFLMGINSFIGTIWGATNNEKKLIKSSLINLIICGPMLFFGSQHGALGLAWCYTFSFAVFELYLWWDFKKSIGITIHHDMFLWAIGLVLFALSFYLTNNFSFLIQLAVIVLVIALIFCYLYNTSKELITKKIN